MKRFLPLLVILLVLLALILVFLFVVPRGFLHFLGIDTQQSDNYDFTSGIGPMIIALLGYTGILITAWHHINCHVDGCPWPGRFPVGDGRFKTCRKHHPDPVVREGVKAHHLVAAHEAHQRFQVVKQSQVVKQQVTRKVTPKPVVD